MRNEYFPNFFITGCTFILLALLTACGKWDLEQESFPEVTTLHFETGRNATEGYLFGEIAGLSGNDAVEEAGHIWSPQSDALISGSSVNRTKAGSRNNGQFQGLVSGLSPGKSYYYRAYVRDESQQILYGEVKNFQTEYYSPELVIDSISRQTGAFQVSVFMTISNLPSGASLPVKSYGVTWADHPFPDINSDPYYPEQNTVIQVSSFQSIIEAVLPPGQSFLRPFLLIENEIYYGNSIPFRIGDVWDRRAYEPPRYNAVGFAIGQMGFVGLGVPAGKDFREFNPQTNSWIPRADFSGMATEEAVGFAIGQKGYIGTGRDGNFTSKKDFWEYNPQTHTWTQRADFKGEPRYAAVGFSIGQMGYIGTGRDNLQYFDDFWEYDTQADTWTKRADFGGGLRAWAVGFAIGKMGYLGTGFNGSYSKDFWMYNPQADAWTKQADFGGGPRSIASGFVIGQRGYVGTGWDGNQGLKDFWEYDSQADNWIRRADFGGEPVVEAIGFSIGQSGYIGFGREDNNGRSDFWEYFPD